MTLFASYLPLLLATIAVEWVIAMLLCRERRTPLSRDLVLLNLITHPLATFLVGQQELDWGMTEAAVFAAEAIGYAMATRIPWRKACVLSAACNAVTAGMSFAFA